MITSNGVSKATLASMSVGGSDYINDTTLHTGKYMCIEVKETATFTTLTTTNVYKNGSVLMVAGDWGNSGVVSAGEVLRGYFTDIQLSSGVIQAHKEY